MRVDVVGDHEICRTVLGAHGRGQFLVEEGRFGRHSTLARGGSDIHRRLDAEARYAPCDRVLEQITVVAGDFDHEGSATESEAFRGVVDERLRVLHPGVGVRGEVCVLGECVFRGDQRGNLQ